MVGVPVGVDVTPMPNEGAGTDVGMREGRGVTVGRDAVDSAEADVGVGSVVVVDADVAAIMVVPVPPIVGMGVAPRGNGHTVEQVPPPEPIVVTGGQSPTPDSTPHVSFTHPSTVLFSRQTDGNEWF